MSFQTARSELHLCESQTGTNFGQPRDNSASDLPPTTALV